MTLAALRAEYFDADRLADVAYSRIGRMAAVSGMAACDTPFHGDLVALLWAARSAEERATVAYNAYRAARDAHRAAHGR